MSNSEWAYFDNLHAEKYRDKDQTKLEHARQFAKSTATNKSHENEIFEIVSEDRFIPAGRVQAAMGATEREVSAFNCSVSRVIEDNMESIMEGVKEAAMILRLGTGIGYNFSKLRPKGDLIKKLQTQASGPVSFAKIYDVMASTIASSGHRRGAQMFVLDIDHPDIEQFIDAKMEKGALRQFNLSVNVSDEFMETLRRKGTWQLKFNGVVYKEVSAEYLWDKIMYNAYMSAEPGVLFLGRVNYYNNLYYCEKIDATNPCAEQPLPPHGLCLLGSHNLPKYLKADRMFDLDMYRHDAHVMCEAYDNIFERSTYAIEAHKKEAVAKRRMGMGMTGIASGVEYAVGRKSYGEHDFNVIFEQLARLHRDFYYEASIGLARKRGAFPLFQANKYLKSEFIKTLPSHLRKDIGAYGIRNSHLLSYAPCGTISQTVGNVSSGVEPIFYHSVKRDVYMKEGKINVTLNDYMYREHGFEGKTLEDCTIEEHLAVLEIAQQYCDSAVSKTINVPSSYSLEAYKNVYVDAYNSGSKGLTVFRPNDIVGVVITSADKEKPVNKPQKQFVYGESGSCVDGVCAL